MSPGGISVEYEMAKLIEDALIRDVREFLGIDLPTYHQLPEEERREKVEGVSYKTWSSEKDKIEDVMFRNNTVTFFLSSVCAKDKNEEIRRLARKKLSYGDNLFEKVGGND